MNNIFAYGLLRKLKSVLPGWQPCVGLHEPQFRGNEWKYLKECLDTGRVSSEGRFVDLFERQLAEFAGARRAIAVVNGTAALHVCLILAGVRRDDEVLVPALTFVATANAVSYCGAVPHFVESEERTLGIDPDKLGQYLQEIAELRDDGCYNRRTGRRIRTMVPMHTFGHPVDLDPLLDLCDRYRISLVEDAAEALGSFYKGRHCGNHGIVAAISFNGSKTITTGGGGAIITNDDRLAHLAKHLTTTAKLPHKWSFSHDMVGYNYRMPNLNAALGCAQLELLPEFLTLKRELAATYRRAFNGAPGLRFVVEPQFARSNYWLNAVLLDEERAELRDEVLEVTNSAGIQTRPVWTLMSDLEIFSDCPRMELSVARSLKRRLINIPSTPLKAKALHGDEGDERDKGDKTREH